MGQRWCVLAAAVLLGVAGGCFADIVWRRTQLQATGPQRKRRAVAGGGGPARKRVQHRGDTARRTRARSEAVCESMRSEMLNSA